MYKLRPLLDGLMLTLKRFFSKPITMRYPEEKWDFPDRFRGRMVLLKNSAGATLCVACGLCEKICPCSCISVSPETGSDGKRKMARYQLDLTRCCFCGLCVEACPVGAICLGTGYEMASADKKDLMLAESILLEGSVQSEGNDG